MPFIYCYKGRVKFTIKFMRILFTVHVSQFLFFAVYISFHSVSMSPCAQSDNRPGVANTVA